jgi:GNAT superfamily N-acetyltransferase
MASQLDGAASDRILSLAAARSRTIPVPHDAEVWAIVCFLVRTGFRRRDVASALLTAAVEYARGLGASAIEGYPIDPAGRRIDATSAYVGTTSMFESAGFRRVLETSARARGCHSGLCGGTSDP